MGKRFKRTNNETPEAAPSTPPVVLQEAPPFLSAALDAFENAYGAIFAQTIIESKRLKKMNAAIEVLEEKLLNLEEIKKMDSLTQVELYNALRANAGGSTRLLMDISRNITQTRAVASIMANLRRMAEAYEQKQAAVAPNQRPEKSKVGYRIID